MKPGGLGGPGGIGGLNDHSSDYSRRQRGYTMAHQSVHCRSDNGSVCAIRGKFDENNESRCKMSGILR